jgi:predicted TPR repeat methyltransferase
MIMYAAPPSHDPAAMAEQCYASAYEALSNGDDDNAARLFALMALLAPRDERCWVGLAVSRERRGDLRSALGFYGMGAALAPRSGWCELGRARALRALGRDHLGDQALDQAEALADDPALVRAIVEERKAS